MSSEIVLLGSSLAACKLGFNWTSLIIKKYKIFNYGINGALIPDIQRQFEALDTFDSKLKPSAVIIIVGGNDVKLVMPGLNKAIADKLGAARNGLQPLDRAEFAKEFRELIEATRKRFGEMVAIAVVNMRHSSEVTNSQLNKIIRDYNEELENVVKGAGDSCHLIDLYSALNHLTRDQGIDDINLIVSPARMVSVMMKRAMSFGLWSFDDLGKSNGFQMSCDGLHFNETTGKILADLINTWLTTKLAVSQ